MGRVIGLLPGGQVAPGVAAIGWLNAESVVAANMALRTGRDLAGRRHLVRVGEREAGGAVIELAVRPSCDGVAGATGGGSLREISSDVIGYVATQSLRAGPCRLVAAHAIGVRGIQRVIVIGVALSTWCGRVRTGQSEAG